MRHLPFPALVASVTGLALPVLGALARPDVVREPLALLWLMVLVPVFLLAYYQRKRGAALALLAATAALVLTELAAFALGRGLPTTLPGVVLALLAVGASVGWLAEKLHKQRDVVEDLAFTDLLTALPNRRHARVFLENEFAAAERGRPVSVILFDLDQFKQYNDTYGHQAGDEALVIFADILARTTRRMNLSARFGGEEFLSVVAGSDVEGAFVFAERVRTALRARSLGSPPLTVSGGVAEYGASMRTPDDLLAAADQALYTAKRAGRNCVRVSAYPDFHLSRPARSGVPVPRPSRAAGDEAEVATAVGAGRASPAAGAEPASDEARRILVCEDDTQVRRLIATSLVRDGFEVEECADVRSGLERLVREFDVVVTDIRLPGESGDRLVTAVKARWPATQVIVVSGLQDAQVATDAINAGADRYLFKPFGMEELRAHLTEAFRRRDAVLAERADSLEALTTGSGRRRSEDPLKGARALVRAVELRDPFTRGHAQRVARYAQALAETLDPDGRILERDALRLACELHDVGKITVPEAILNKAEPLTPEELRQVRQHAAIGRRILEPFLDDELVLGAARWHHEWWNGKGYPDGLAGEGIPMVARVLALAEALAALTEPRAYRGPLGWDEAMAEVRARSGEQFDPALVALLEDSESELRQLHAAPGPTTAGAGRSARSAQPIP